MLKMTDTFMMELQRIQPSQLYINSEKLDLVMEEIDPSRVAVLRPIPDTVGEFGIAIRSGLENPDYRSVGTLLLPIDGTFQSR